VNCLEELPPEARNPRVEGGASGVACYWNKILPPSPSLPYMEDLERGWARQPKVVAPYFAFEPGQYDTQTALYQALDISEPDVVAAVSSFTDTEAQGEGISGLKTEEELLSLAYKEGPPNAGDRETSSSRWALRHEESLSSHWSACR
jgi:hypothetical protein